MRGRMVDMEHMSLEQKEAQVKKYFRNVIMGYLACDIHTLLNSELDEKIEGGCSAPLAMTVFSAMNQLGYLTSKKNTDEIVKEARTEECIKEFCNDWMKKDLKAHVLTQMAFGKPTKVLILTPPHWLTAEKPVETGKVVEPKKGKKVAKEEIPIIDK